MAHAGFDLNRPEIRAFVAQAPRRVGMTRKRLVALLAQAEPQESIIEAMSRPAETVLPWWQYRERFLSEKRITAGIEFWDEHRELLDRLAAERGVPAEYLVAIVGVETFYGRNLGRYRVLDALATLGFDYPPRAEFFRKEFEQFLLMVRDKDVDPLSAMGSYAGAMGAPQFMPSSYRRYAVDANHDGRRDLWTEWDDVLYSVANFLVEHGWRRGEPVLAEAAGSNEADDPLSFSLELSDRVGLIKGRGYQFETPQDDAAPAMLVPAEQAESMAWRVGFQNFYVITRYNRSPRYAMAVHDLAQALLTQKSAGHP